MVRMHGVRQVRATEATAEYFSYLHQDTQYDLWSSCYYPKPIYETGLASQSKSRETKHDGKLDSVAQLSRSTRHCLPFHSHDVGPSLTYPQEDTD